MKTECWGFEDMNSHLVKLLLVNSSYTCCIWFSRVIYDRELIVGRITVMKFGVSSGGGKGAGSWFTSVIIAGFRWR